MAANPRRSDLKLASSFASAEKPLLRTLRMKISEEVVSGSSSSSSSPSPSPSLSPSPSPSPRKSFMSLRNLNFWMGSNPKTQYPDEGLASSSPDASPKKSSIYLRSVNFRCGSPTLSMFACGLPSAEETHPWIHSGDRNSLADSNDRTNSQSLSDSRLQIKVLAVKNQDKLSSEIGHKMLVTVNVLGSAGNLRFVVDTNDPVSRVIELVLKAYSKEGRLPSLGLDPSHVRLYGCICDFEALDPLQLVGSVGTRLFFLHKKKIEEIEQAAAARNEQAASMPWKLWWNVKSTIACSA